MMETLNSIEPQLCGTTLGEKHKKLNQMVNESSVDTLKLEGLGDLKKKTQIDLVYFGRLANHVKNGEIICELLKSDSSMVVSVALQSKWLFTGTTHLHLINVQYFDKEIFPQATLHTIHRVVSTLGACLRNERLAEDFYQYVGEEFGKKLAFKLLPKCSLSFIRSEIMDNVCEVPCAQMYSIYKKDSALAVEYLEKYLNHEKYNELAEQRSFKKMYDKVWKQVAFDNPELFNKLLEKDGEKIEISLGQKTADKILKICLPKVVDNPEKFSDVFSDKYIVNALQGELLEKFLYNSLPLNQDDLVYYGNCFVCLKPEFRLKMLLKLYPMKYKGASFLDKEDFLDWDLCKYLSKEDRIQWAKNKIEHCKTHEPEKTDDYLKYLDQNEGISRLKFLCTGTCEQHKRAKYLVNMVECCSVNSDLEALLQLLKYVATRHRNDKAETRKMFLDKVKDLFTMRELSAEYWELINEMVDFLCVENEIAKNYWGEHFVFEILLEYINYCLVNNLEINSTVDKIIKYNSCFAPMQHVCDNIKDQDLKAKTMTIFVDKYKEYYLTNDIHSEGDKEEQGYKTHHILCDIIECLLKCDHMSVYQQPWLLEYIMKNHKDWVSYRRNEIFLKIRDDPKIKELYPNELFVNSYDHKWLKNFVMFKPDIVLNNTKYFVNSTLKLKGKFNLLYNKIFTYMRTNLGDKIVENLKEYIEEENIKDNRKLVQYLICYCYLLPPKQRRELIQQYSPKDLKVDLLNNQQEYECGQYFGTYMKMFDPPVEFDILMSFVGGDYLKYSLTSLLSVCFKRPLNETKSFVQSLIKHPVSVKKHSIRLSYFILPRRELLPLYKALWETETNSTITDVLFVFTYKLLLTEKDMEKYKEIWETLKYFMTRFDMNFMNVFKYLTKPQEINPAFVNEYCETCWQQLKDLAARGFHVQQHKIDFVKNISLCMQWLSEEFCESMRKEYLSSLDNHGPDSSNLLWFLVNNLLNAKKNENQTKYMNSVLSKLKEFINTNWDTKVDEKYKYRAVVNDFVIRCCTMSLNTKLELSPVNLLSNVSAMLTSSLPQAAVLYLHTVLDITLCFVELSRDPRFKDYDGLNVTSLECQMYEQFGTKLSSLLDDFSACYGTFSIPIFRKALDMIVSLLCPAQNQTLSLNLALGFVGLNSSDACYIFAIERLPSKRPDDVGHLYDQIIDKIIENGSLAVKLSLNDKIELQSKYFDV